MHINGKPFAVCREIIHGEFYNQHAMEAIDRVLVQKMEVMLKQILSNACGAIPPGTEILEKERNDNA